MGLVTGAIFQVIGGGQSVFRTQPDVADVHQRLRIAIDMIYQDLLSAGSGVYLGASAGPLVDHFPAVRLSGYLLT